MQSVDRRERVGRNGQGMRLMERVLNWLTFSASTVNKKGHPDLYPLDVDKLAKELRLAEEAKRLGEARLPSVDAQNLAGAEASVVQRIHKARQDYVDWAALRIGILNEKLSKCNVTETVNRAREADKEFELMASNLLSEKESLLQSLGDAASKSSADLEEFRLKNGLTRDAHYPTVTRAFFHYSLLLLLIVIEGGLNAGFFAQGLSTGLLGGFTTAGTLAALNVIAAFFFGKVLIRNLNHCRIDRKVLGAVALLIAIAVMSAMGLGIAHVRDCLTAEIPDPARVALQSLLASPFQLRDFFSWALFAISVAFGTGAIIDGLYSDDLYPGYGSLSKRTLSTINDFQDELSTLRAELQDLKDQQLKALDKVVIDSQVSIATFESHIDDKKAVESKLSGALQNALKSLEALLQKFRTENQLHRGDAPCPAYFNNIPKMPPLQLPNFDITEDKAALAVQRDLVKKLIEELQRLRANIQESFNQRFDRLQPLNSHFSKNGIA